MARQYMIFSDYRFYDLLADEKCAYSPYPKSMSVWVSFETNRKLIITTNHEKFVYYLNITSMIYSNKGASVKAIQKLQFNRKWVSHHPQS